MEKNLCSLVVLNLKNATRIVGNNILQGKRSGLVHFNDLQQVKLALKMQENNSLVIQTEIPVEILREVDPTFAEQLLATETAAQEVQLGLEKVVEPIAEEVAAEVKPKRKKKNS